MSYKDLHDSGDYSLVWIAAECGVNQRTVQNWYHGRFLPKLEYMPILKRKYNLSYNQLIPILLKDVSE